MAMRRYAQAILYGMVLLLMTRILAEYLLAQNFSVHASFLAEVFMKDCISLAVGAFAAGYRARSWLAGLAVSCCLAIGLVGLWTYMSASPLSNVLSGVAHHPIILLEFPALLGIGALAGAAGQALRNKTAEDHLRQQ